VKTHESSFETHWKKFEYPFEISSYEHQNPKHTHTTLKE